MSWAESNGRKDSQRPDGEIHPPHLGKTKELGVYPGALGWGRRDTKVFWEVM